MPSRAYSPDDIAPLLRAFLRAPIGAVQASPSSSSEFVGSALVDEDAAGGKVGRGWGVGEAAGEGGAGGEGKGGGLDTELLRRLSWELRQIPHEDMDVRQACILLLISHACILLHTLLTADVRQACILLLISHACILLHALLTADVRQAVSILSALTVCVANVLLMCC